MRQTKRKLLAAWWAFRNPDNLTMLRHELVTDSKRRNYGDGEPLATHRAWWYLTRYLEDLPIK